MLRVIDRFASTYLNVAIIMKRCSHQYRQTRSKTAQREAKFSIVILSESQGDPSTDQEMNESSERSFGSFSP